MKEEVDIVDAHDNLVDTADKRVAHKKGLLHRVVHVMVFNPSGELYVQQRALKKDLFPGYWEGSVSGHVQSGETPTEAAERELHEELSICVSPRHLKKVLRFGLHEDKRERVLVTLFAVRDFKGVVRPEKVEVKQGGFWSMDKLARELKGKKLFHPLFVKALRVFKGMSERTQDYLTL